MPHLEIGDSLRICPSLDNLPDDDRGNLIIAKGAFGSGEHETSASCLEILEGMALDGKRVLDLGSGTGILAIGALHLGALEAICIDISPDAVRTCRANCEANGFGERTRHIAGDLASLEEGEFDLVLANIYGDLLLDLAGPLVAKVRGGGHLLLSGILWEYNFEVRQHYQALGCRLQKNRMLEEFSTMLLEKSA